MLFLKKDVPLCPKTSIPNEQTLQTVQRNTTIYWYHPAFTTFRPMAYAERQETMTNEASLVSSQKLIP